MKFSLPSFKHPFAFGGGTQQQGPGFLIGGTLPGIAGGKSHLLNVTLDSDLISELEVWQVNDVTQKVLLNDVLYVDGVSMVRRTGPKTWQFRTLTEQGRATKLDMAYLYLIFKVYGPTGETLWTKTHGPVMNTQAEVNREISADSLARGGWAPGMVKPAKINVSRSLSPVTGMTPELLASLMPGETPQTTVDEEGNVVIVDETVVEGGMTTGEKVAIGAGLGTALLAAVYAAFRVFFGGKK